MSSQQLLHPRNLHQGRYDFAALIATLPQLEAYVRLNPSAEPTIDFTDSQAVLLLNQALLAKYYQVKYWQLPPGYLCPPIPGRADYVHYLADLLARSYNEPPKGKQINCLILAPEPMLFIRLSPARATAGRCVVQILMQ